MSYKTALLDHFDMEKSHQKWLLNFHPLGISNLCVSCSVMSDSLWPHGLPEELQATLSMELSRQDYWNGLPFPSPRDLLDARIKLRSCALQVDSLPSEPPGKLQNKLAGPQNRDGCGQETRRWSFSNQLSHYFTGYVFFVRKITGSPFSPLEMSSVPFQLFSSTQAGWGASIPGLCLTSRMILAVCTWHRE